MKEYMKERYKNIKNNWGDFETEYYIQLNCIDRLCNLLIKRYGYFAKAERELGYNSSELNSKYNLNSGLFRLKGLKRLCKNLDVSFQWALFGEGEMKYTCNDITFANLYKVYMNNYWLKKNPIVTSSICQAYNKKAISVPLKYIIRIAREQHKTIDWLLGG